jgi:hypothetical protein
MTTAIFGALAAGTLIRGGFEATTGSMLFSALSMVGALGWAVLTQNRAAARVVIDGHSLKVSGHLKETIDLNHVTHLSMSRASRLSYDVSVLMNDGSVHRLASNLPRPTAELLVGTVRQSCRPAYRY